MNKEKEKTIGTVHRGFRRSSYFLLLTSSPRRGFSLVESIVAIAILAVVVTAPLTLAQRSLNASAYAKDQVTAFYLAEEALEYVRNVRDGNNLSGASWLAGLSTCLNQLCGLDVTADNSSYQRIFACASVSDCALTFNPGSGIYGVRRDGSGNPDSANGWQNSPFTRVMRVSSPVAGSGDEAEVEVAVSWKTGLLAKSITLRSKIFNWFPR